MPEEKKFPTLAELFAPLAPIVAPALKEIGRVGAKAIAAGVKSAAVDVRRAVREADEYLKGVEERSEKRSHDKAE